MFKITLTRAQMRAVVLFSGRSDLRYYLNTVALQVDEAGAARLLASDGHRMAVLNLGQQRGADAGEYLIPREAAAGIKRAARKNKAGALALEIDGDAFRVIDRADDSILAGGGLVDGKFPDWQRVVPLDTSGEAANFNPVFLCGIDKAARELDSGDRYNLAHNGQGPGLTVLPNAQMVIVTMPMRCDEHSQRPDWIMPRHLPRAVVEVADPVKNGPFPRDPEQDVSDKLAMPSGEEIPAMPSGEKTAHEQVAAICSAGLPTVANHALLGEIIELRTVDGDAVRVARKQFENSGLTIMATFTRNGDRKGGRGIHRGNLLTAGTELTPAALLEAALKAHGWSVARYPRSAEQRAKLAGMGFKATIQTAPGQFEPHPLGLAWAKPGAVVASGEEIAPDAAGATTAELRAKAHEFAKARKWNEAADYYQRAAESYPARFIFPGSLGAFDVEKLKTRAIECRAQAASDEAVTTSARNDAIPSGEVKPEPVQTLMPGRWIPGGAQNAERIAFDAALGAEVWLIASTARAGALAVIAYAGKRTKPDARYTMRDRAQALQWAGEYMGKLQAAAQRQAERRAEKAAKRAAGHKLKPGDVLRCSWGYDQTNIDYYEVTRLIGKRMVEIRAIGAESVESGGMTGECVPRLGHYIGEPMRKAVSDYDGKSVRIASYASAHKIEPREVAGVKVYPVDYWTAYA